MYLIIGIWGGANRIYATIKFVLYTLVGSLLMLVAILATAFAYQAAHAGSWAGAFDFEQLREFAATTGFASGLQLAAFLAFFLAFAIKVPMFPFHTWLPDAHVEAPTAGSVILAAILLKLGAYGFIRFALPLFPDAAHTFAPAIIVLSLIAIIYGAIVALVQPDLKKLVAYSSVSHMGFVTLGIFVFNEQGMQGAILQMVNHGLITGALFLLVGVIYERTHDRTIAKMGGVAGVDAGLRRGVRILRLRLGRAARACRASSASSSSLVGAFAFSPCGRRDRHVLHDPRRGLPAVDVPAGRRSASCPTSCAGLGHHLTDMTPIEILTLAPLGALVVVFGVVPGLLLDLVQGSVANVLDDVGRGAPIPIAPRGRRSSPSRSRSPTWSSGSIYVGYAGTREPLEAGGAAR